MKKDKNKIIQPEIFRTMINKPMAISKIKDKEGVTGRVTEHSIYVIIDEVIENEENGTNILVRAMNRDGEFKSPHRVRPHLIRFLNTRETLKVEELGVKVR